MKEIFSLEVGIFLMLTLSVLINVYLAKKIVLDLSIKIDRDRELYDYALKNLSKRVQDEEDLFYRLEDAIDYIEMIISAKETGHTQKRYRY